MLNISLPSTAITELESYRWYDASGASLKDVITSIYFSAASAVDVSDWVTQINISGSVNNYSGEPGANRAQVQLNNFDKRFSDLNTAGPYYGFLSPGKSVKIELNVAGTLVPIFTGKISPQGFIETREGTQGTAMFEILDGADALERKKFDKDYYYTAKNLVDVTSTANSLLHILLETHGSLASTNIVCNGSVSILVDYTVFKEGESVQQRLREIATGCLAQYCGFRYDGKFVMESRLVKGWSVPASEYLLDADALNVNVSKTLSPLLGNHVKVRGDKTAYLDQGVVLWELRKVKPIGGNAVYPGWCWEAVNSGDTYLCGPSTASTQSEYWAEYAIDNADILHIDSAAMTMKVWEGAAYNLTTTGTDLAAESKRAKLVLQNLSGSTVHVMNIQIMGKAAIRYSIGKKSEDDIKRLKIDQGISDDDLNWGRIAVDSNASSIAAYGQTDLVVSSEYIVDDAQLVNILDWNLKYGKDPKHHFAIEQLPFLAFVQPGADLTLKLSELGYSALTEVAQFSHNITPNGATSMLELIETPTQWSVSSVSSVVPVQTIISAPSGGTGQGEIGAAAFNYNATYTIAPSGSGRPADAICDGAADDVEINAGIDYVMSTYGGGTILLLEGQFNISAPISVSTNIRIMGNGPATIINNQNSGGYYGFNMAGIGSGSVPNSITSKLTDFSMMGETGAAHVFCRFTTDVEVSRIQFNDCSYTAIDAQDCIRCYIANNVIYGDSSGNFNGILAYSNTNGVIKSNKIIGLRNTNFCRGIYVGSDDIIVQDNYIYDISVSGASSVEAFGIVVSNGADRNIIRNNHIEQVKHTGAATDKAWAIVIDSSLSNNTMVYGNFCFNNGLDTSLANTNGNNFRDLGTDTGLS